MVSVTQEGNLSAPLSGGLFDGKSFWVSIAVLGRAKLVVNIKANGGVIAHAEKEADICIAGNNVAHITPWPLFSPRFITDSIRKGELEDLESHRIQPVPPKSSNGKAKVKVLSSQIPRKRSHFSAKDDRILLRWVSKPGAMLGGNKLYQELENAYPSHSYHSWRARWIDHFAKRNSDPAFWYNALVGDKGFEDGGVVDELAEDPITVNALKKSDLNPTKSPGSKRLRKSSHRGCIPFTERDREILMGFSRKVIDADDPSEVWERLHQKLPHHDASEWCKYYNENIAPQLESKNRRKQKETLKKEKISLLNHLNSPSPKLNEKTNTNQPSKQQSSPINPTFASLVPMHTIQTPPESKEAVFNTLRSSSQPLASHSSDLAFSTPITRHRPIHSLDSFDILQTEHKPRWRAERSKNAVRASNSDSPPIPEPTTKRHYIDTTSSDQSADLPAAAPATQKRKRTPTNTQSPSHKRNRRSFPLGFEIPSTPESRKASSLRTPLPLAAPPVSRLTHPGAGRAQSPELGTASTLQSTKQTVPPQEPPKTPISILFDPEQVIETLISSPPSQPQIQQPNDSALNITSPSQSSIPSAANKSGFNSFPILPSTPGNASTASPHSTAQHTPISNRLGPKKTIENLIFSSPNQLLSEQPSHDSVLNIPSRLQPPILPPTEDCELKIPPILPSSPGVPDTPASTTNTTPCSAAQHAAQQPPTQSISPTGSKGAELKTFIEKLRRSFPRATNQQIVYAISRTGGFEDRQHLVENVLAALVRGDEVPSHIPGVWSEADDAVLLGNDGKAIQELEYSRPAWNWDERFQFLQAWEMNAKQRKTKKNN